MLPGVESAAPRAIHRTRVASRRLRELLPVLQLDASTTHRLGRRLRKVTRTLGTVREADVLLLLIEELENDTRYDRKALGLVADEVRAEREKAGDRISGKATVAELRRVGHKLRQVADRLEERDDVRSRSRGWRWALEARVARRAQTLRATMAAAGAVYLPERLHEVRLALKKLRYAVELSADANGTRKSADLRLLKRTQELLGRLHDLQVLIDWVRRAQASSSVDRGGRRRLDTLVETLEHACRHLHARYVRERRGLADLCDRAGVKAQSAARRTG
jgi:CHAD domain-containing protein